MILMLTLGLVVFLVMGLPVALALGLSALGATLLGGMPLLAIVQRSARILGVEIPHDAAHEVAFLESALADLGVRAADVGLLVLGANGDPGLDAIHAAVARALIAAGLIVAARSVEGGASRTFTTPFPGPAALYLKLVRQSAP